MSDIIRFAAFGLTAAVLAVTVRKSAPEAAVPLSLAAGALILLMALGYLTDAVEAVKRLAEQYALAAEAFRAVLKITGVAYLCEFAVQIIRDAGEGSIGGKVELAGKLIILSLTIPLLGDLLSVVTGMLS